MAHGFTQGCEPPPPTGLRLGYQNDGTGELWLAVANTEWGRIPGKAKDGTCWYGYGGTEYDTTDFDWVTFPNTMTTIPNSGDGPPPSARPIGYQTDGRGDVWAAIANTEWGRIAGKANDNTCWYEYYGTEHETDDFEWLASCRMIDGCAGEKMDIDFVQGCDPPLHGLNFGNQYDRGEHWMAVANTPWGKIPGKAQDGTCWYGIGGVGYETQDFHWLIYTSPHRFVRNDDTGPPDDALITGYQEDGRGDQYAAIALTEWGRIPGKAVADNICWFPYGGEEHETTDFEWIVFAS